MKRLLTAALVVTASASAAAKDGPFGFQFGDDPKAYSSCKPRDKTGFYECETAPKSHPDFTTYVIMAAEGYGICVIKGVGPNIETDPFGLALRKKADDIADQVSIKYGRPELVDKLASWSMLSSQNEWTASMSKNERKYSYAWKSDNQNKFMQEISDIYVYTKAVDREFGYIVAEFYAKNFDECQSALKKQDADKF